MRCTADENKPSRKGVKKKKKILPLLDLTFSGQPGGGGGRQDDSSTVTEVSHFSLSGGGFGAKAVCSDNKKNSGSGRPGKLSGLKRVIHVQELGSIPAPFATNLTPTLLPPFPVCLQ